MVCHYTTLYHATIIGYSKNKDKTAAATVAAS